MNIKQKFQTVMHEWKHAKLMSHGKKVTDQTQAIRIAFEEARKVNPFSSGGSMATGGGIDKKYVIRVGETYDHSGGKVKVLRTYEEEGIPMVDYEYSNGKITKPETQTLRGFITTVTPVEHKYVAISETKDGYWVIMSKPSTKEDAQSQIDLGVPRGEIGKVVTLEEAIEHKKNISKEDINI